MSRIVLMRLTALACALLLLVTTGCDDDGGNGNPDAISDAVSDATDTGDDTDVVPGHAIEVAGTWQTPFDTTEAITDTMWDFMILHEFDSDANLAITQNPSDAMFGPDTFNRIVWTEPAGDVFHYCTVAFGLETIEEARASTATADANDLEAGCGGFAWTMMTRVP